MLGPFGVRVRPGGCGPRPPFGTSLGAGGSTRVDLARLSSSEVPWHRIPPLLGPGTLRFHSKKSWVERGPVACGRVRAGGRRADARRVPRLTGRGLDVSRSWRREVLAGERICEHPASLARFARSLGGVRCAGAQIRWKSTSRERSERGEKW